jgi:serine/threonine protein phosphatase 1
MQAEPDQGNRPGSPAVPPGRRIYAIGDVHGRVDLLAEMHRLIDADHAARPPAEGAIVYLGDLVDRGPASAEVIELLLGRPLPDLEAVYLLGNHEDSLLRFLDDISVGPAWLFYGGVETLESYGIAGAGGIWDDPTLRRLQAELRARLPRPHRDFLARLRLAHVEGDYLFVHAGIRPGLPLEAQQRDDLLWIRDEFLQSRADHGRVVVHGHTISQAPEMRRNRIGIDTGACFTGRLTCLGLEGTARWLLQT